MSYTEAERKAFARGYGAGLSAGLTTPEPLDVPKLVLVAREYVGPDGRISLDDLDAIAAEYDRLTEPAA